MKSKMTLILAVLAIAITSQAHAQVYIGGVGGMNIARFNIEETADPVIENNAIRQAAGGVVFGIKLGDRLSLQTTPMYIRKGSDVIPEAGDPEFAFRTSYLEVPLFLKLEFGNRVKPYLLAGPAIGFRLDSEATAVLNDVEFVADLQDVTEKTDLGLGLGGGISLPLGRFSLVVEGRYSIGFDDIVKDGPVQFKAGDVVIDDELQSDAAVKNQGIQIIAGITLPLGN